MDWAGLEMWVGCLCLFDPTYLFSNVSGLRF